MLRKVEIIRCHPAGVEKIICKCIFQWHKRNNYKHFKCLFFNNLEYVLFKKQIKPQVTKQRLLFVLLRW